MSRCAPGTLAAAAALLAATACATAPVPSEVRETSGRVASLEVEDPSSRERFDEAGDLEVVVHLDGLPDRSFGFRLQTGSHQAARHGMLDLLRDALRNDWTVTLGYIVAAGRDDGVIVWTRLTQSPRTAPGVRVVEVPQLPRMADDPVLRGVRSDPAPILDQLPDPPAEFARRGAHALMERTEWTLVDEVEVGPGQAQEQTVSFDEAVLLQARATWFGSAGPVEMVATQGGMTLGAGNVYPSPPNSGTLTLAVEIESPGSATVSVVNRGPVPVGVEMVLGLLPLAALQE